MKTLFLNATILDGTPDMTPQKGKYIAVDDGIITDIGDESPKSIQKGTDIIDLNGRFLMPGLINMHVHLPGGGAPQKGQRDNTKLAKLADFNFLTRSVALKMCENSARTQLLSGVTTIRTVGGLTCCDSTIRDKINAGKLDGPRMLVSNMAISVENGHMAGSVATIAHTSEDCRRQVRKLIRQKVDLIKIMITGGVLDASEKGKPGELKMPPELVKACCEEAHAAGLKVAAHVEGSEGLKAALENGVDSIEHGAKPDAECIRLFKKHGAYDICTLSPAIPCVKFPRSITGATEVMQYNGKIVMNGIIDCAKEALANDIPVGLGTDSACPYSTQYNMWREVVYFHKFCDVSPAFALHTATLKNAELAGIADETGSIRVGKAADFIVTLKNPLEDLTELREPYLVAAKGKVYLKPHVKKIHAVEQQLDAYMEKLTKNPSTRKTVSQ